MPEGDTIKRLAGRIRERFVGQRVVRDVFRHPRLATDSFEGRTLTSTASYGKHLFLRFDDDRSLHVHLLMQGRVLVGSSPQGRRGRLDDETWRQRFEMWFEHGPLIGIDIPLLHLLPTRDEHSFTDDLGPDLCVDDFDAERDLAIGVERMLQRPDAALGDALLDQHNLAGFGNIYAVETPFICGVSPFEPVGTVDRLRELVEVGAALIRTNADRGPQNTTGRRLTESEQWLLAGGHQHCKVCRARLRRVPAEQVPWQRRTVQCPTCQPDGCGSVDLDRAERLLRLHPAHRRVSWPEPTQSGE